MRVYTNRYGQTTVIEDKHSTAPQSVEQRVRSALITHGTWPSAKDIAAVTRIVAILARHNNPLTVSDIARQYVVKQAEGVRA